MERTKQGDVTLSVHLSLPLNLRIICHPASMGNFLCVQDFTFVIVFVFVLFFLVSVFAFETLNST